MGIGWVVYKRVLQRTRATDSAGGVRAARAFARMVTETRRTSLTILLVIFTLSSPSMVLQTGAVREESPWQAEVGGFTRVNAIDALSRNDAWAAGSNIVHFDGKHWRSVDQAEVAAYYKGIDMIETGEGWVVGSELAVSIRHGALGEVLSLPGVTLYDVSLYDIDNGWAVGKTDDNGVVYQLSRGRWRLAFEVPRAVLFGIWSPDPELVWVVGENGIAIRFDGSLWHESPPVTSETLFAVNGTAPDIVWAGGGRLGDAFGAGARSVLALFDGREWSLTREWVAGAIQDMDFREDIGFSIGQYGDVVSFYKNEWRDFSGRVPVTGYQPARAITLPPGEKYPMIGAETGGIYQVEEEGTFSPADIPQAITGVAFLDGNRGWAVDGTSALVLDHGTWLDEIETSPLHQAKAIDVVSPELAWAVGDDGLILRWDGEEWSESKSPTDLPLSQVRAKSDTHAWASGSQQSGAEWHSVVLEYNGDAWRKVWDRIGGEEARVSDVDGSASGEPWIAGPHGIWRRPDGEWLLERFGRENGASSIAVLAENAAWLARRGTIFNWNGKCWNEQIHLSAAILRMRVAADATGWAVGSDGYVIRLRDGQWKVLRGPEQPGGDSVPWLLHDVATSGDEDDARVWVVGGHRTLITAKTSEVDIRQPITPEVFPVFDEPPPPGSTPSATATPDGSIPARLCRPERNAFLPYGSVPIRGED